MAYLPLSTANLPDPAIDPAQGSSPQDYFGTLPYDGSGSTQTVTGLDFEPDFVWIKSRSNATGHYLHDSVRGDTKYLFSNATNAEGDWDGTGNGMVQFVDGGFELSGGTGIDGSTRTYVAWNWKANGSGVSNTDGSITSTVSANTESGFSIVSYTGTGSATNTDTVGHGLGVKPDLYIIKNRDTANSWLVRTDLIDGSSDFLLLDGTAAKSNSSVTYADDSVFSLGSSAGDNGSGDAHIAYCFHSVEGFSKFGSYTGNGSTDGPFVYTGFRPAFVLVKGAGGTSSWSMHDSIRSEENDDAMELLKAQSSDAESTRASIDMLSNGFKVRSSINDYNKSSATMIYMAFAENPFKYSNAR
jgi:hypothetical protein